MSNRKLINLSIVLKVLSFLLMVEGVFMLSGIGFAIYFDEPIWPLLISAFITIIVGLPTFLLTQKNTRKNIGKREGYLIVSLTWVIISIFGSLPFLFSGAIPNYTDAFFETISGFTTTGASILPDIELKLLLFNNRKNKKASNK